uniref:Serine-rich adhesin n=1 Tax=uncultured haloarchaeon TaxID=160804 RepID=A0A0K1YB43_9EURY|nr:serine-rich adhesin [uncultured haloarchaeon]
MNLSSPGTIDVQGVADGASSNTVQQTYTGQSDSITFSANKSVVSTDVGAEITAQAVDSNGNPVERQGLNVRFAEDSGFNDAGVELVSRDGNTSNNGTATAIVQDAGSLSPGQEFTVLANIDGNVERANFSTAAGEIDSSTSTLRLNDSTNDFGDLQVDSTVDVSAEILDANDNPLEGRTVEFASNGTVEFGSDSVDTNSDGFANTTATVDTETQGVVAINATVGNFNTTSTSDAQRNITTIAGDATQLGFASDSRSMAPGASLNPTVQVQDEFGNFNDTASVNNGISVTSSDTNVISVSGVDDLSGNSDQFTLSAESGGEATITVSSDDSDISGVNDTFVVSDPAAIDLSVAHNVATVSANNSNANTQNQALVTAQFTDSDGSALGVANENISFGLSGSSAELNQSDVTTKSTDGDGNVTILVNGTDTTGTSTIVATAENFTSINRGETTVTTTGSASGISLSPENDTIAQNDEINVTAEFVDDEGRNVPRLTDVSLSADDGNVNDRNNRNSTK